MTYAGITFDMALLNDVIQIFILYLVFYWVLRAAKGSRFGQVLTGGVMLDAIISAELLDRKSVV